MRRTMPQRIVTPSQLGPARMATLQEACEFDMDSPALNWMRTTVLKHDTALRRHRLDGRQADLGLRYELEPHRINSGRYQMVCRAYGHRASPRAMHFVYEEKSGHTVDDFNTGEREWLDEVAGWHEAVQRQLDAGLDPDRPGAQGVITDPCLTRLVHHEGVGLDRFLASVPRHGQFIIGRGWRRVTPAPRVIEIDGISAHVIRTGDRIRVIRIGLADGVGYEPPNPDRSRLVGILYVSKLAIPDTLRNALIGQPATRLVEHAAMDAGLRIRAISASGSGLAVRVEGCDPPRPMSDVDTPG